ncbi:YraN family protein [Fusibacter bizertensis]
MANKRAVGQFYEAIALSYFEQNGFEYVTKNYFCPYGEIDLVLNKNNVIYFIEVKYRSNLSYGSPRDAINHTKMQRMKKTALHYIKNQNMGYINFKIGFLGILKTGDTYTFDFIENIFS